MKKSHWLDDRSKPILGSTLAELAGIRFQEEPVRRPRIACHRVLRIYSAIAPAAFVRQEYQPRMRRAVFQPRVPLRPTLPSTFHLNTALTIVFQRAECIVRSALYLLSGKRGVLGSWYDPTWGPSACNIRAVPLWRLSSQCPRPWNTLDGLKEDHLF